MKDLQNKKSTFDTNLLFLCTLILGTHANAQTLAAGDLAFIGYNMDRTDDFAIINLNSNKGGMVIYLTEEGWKNSGD